VGIRVTYSLLLSYFNENWISSTDFRKILNIIFREYKSSGCKFLPCGQRDRQKDTTKLTVAFQSFAKAPKMTSVSYKSVSIRVRRMAHRGGPNSIPGQATWDLWGTKWQWDRCFPKHLGFSRQYYTTTTPYSSISVSV